jgi:DNA processing protein
VISGGHREGHGDPRRRDVCLWLASLASYRGGLVKRLIVQYGGVSEVLDRPVAELRSFLQPRRGRAAAGTDAAPGSAVAAGGGDSPAGAPGSAPARPPRAGDAAERRADLEEYRRILAAQPPQVAAEPPQSGRLVVPWSDPLYPPALRRLADPPLCLFLAARAGERELEARLARLCATLAVAVVGTRGPSPYGADMAALLGRDLALRGVVVVSGLALGVDALAQAAALRAGAGRDLPTVAVLGCGADVVYPRTNAGLYADVLKHGLVVSEFTWGVPARAWRFPARNRVMAGLSRAVVVVEGAQRSGARLTASFAAELGDEVLAVPGEAGRRLTQAPHGLLRHGAALCESADDVLSAVAGVRLDPEELAGEAGRETVARLLEARSDDGRLGAVLRALDGGHVTVDEVAAACGVGVPAAAALLSELEIEGLAAVSGPGTYRLRRV